MPSSTLLKSLKRYGGYFYHEYIAWNVRKALGRRVYPAMLNFSLTGFCNSQCVMCNVWMFPDQRPIELTPDELYTAFRDPLFQNLRHWGVAGGEPFLRKDIAEMCEAGLRALPRLETLTISTHGFHTRRMKEIAPRINDLCKAHGVRFRFSVSLDGVGEVHDRVRGVPGAFNRTWETIKWIRDETDIDLVIGATLSPYNIREAFDLWHFCVRENVPTNFRIATIVERLGNRELLNQMSVKGRDRYALAELFENLAHHRASPMERRFFYLSARRNLTDGVRRFARCRFMDEGLFLHEQGGVHHCAVYGQSVGNVREGSGAAMFFSDHGEMLRQQMFRDACGTCLHDYRTRTPLKEVLAVAARRFRLPQMVNLGINASLTALSQWRPARAAPKSGPRKHYMVIGWYGTETAGDKAILGGIMHTIRQAVPDARFTVVSSLPFYTRNTLQELGESEAQVIDYDYAEIKRRLADVDAVLVGGGPMMDLIGVFDLVRVFDLARRQGVYTAVIGVGIGPFRRKLMRWGVRRLLELADAISVRDQPSYQSVLDWGIPAEKVTLGADPAIVYLHTLTEAAKVYPAQVLPERTTPAVVPVAAIHASGNGQHPHTGRPVIGIAVRDWPRKYAVNLSDQEYTARRAWLQQFWVDLAGRLVESLDADIRLIPMNTLHIGVDDRWLQADIRRQARHHDRITTHSYSYTAGEIAGLIEGCDVLIGMRFHSVVFGTTLGVPTLAVDYTQGGGKVSGHMHALEMDNQVVSIDQLDLEQMVKLVERTFKHRVALTAQLQQQAAAVLPTAERTVATPLRLALDSARREQLSRPDVLYTN